MTYQFQPQTGKNYVPPSEVICQSFGHLETKWKTVTSPESFNDTVTVNVTPIRGRNPDVNFQLNKEAWSENIESKASSGYGADDQDLKRLQNRQLARNPCDRHRCRQYHHSPAKPDAQITIPAAPGWQVQVNGQPVKPKTRLGIFALAIPLKTSHYHITEAAHEERRIPR